VLPKIVFVNEFIYWHVILTRFMSGCIFCLMSVDVLSDSSLVKHRITRLFYDISHSLAAVIECIAVLMRSERCRSVTDQPTVGANLYYGIYLCIQGDSGGEANILGNDSVDHCE